MMVDTTNNHLENVAVIGAGLGGCALAVALSEYKIPVTIYEARPATAELITSGVVLTANGLRILDRLGVLARIKDRCYVSTHRVIKNSKDETVNKTPIDTSYGYTSHRIWRQLLLDEMRQMLIERSVEIHFNSKFNGIVDDGPNGVSFKINSKVEYASLLIGSDGVYSTVRKYLAPEIIPEYMGLVGVIGHIKRASVAWPYDNYEPNATIQDKPGALIWIAENPKAEDLLIAMQVQYPEQSREDLENLQRDKDKLAEFYKKDYDEWGSTAKKIIDRVVENKSNLFIWPFLRIPKFPQWYSESGRVIVIGDGAHALPPSSGQGVNQALEDAFSLTLLLSNIFQAGEDRPASDEHYVSELLDGLRFWQDMRQERVDAIFDYATNNRNVERLPEAERKKLIAEGKIKEKKSEKDDLTWLYQPNIEGKIESWAKNRNSR